MTTTTPKMGNPLPRQQAIEANLSAAQCSVQAGDQQDIQRAAFHANRAAAMLNQACAEARTGGAA